MVLKEHQPTPEEVQAEWMDALEQALSASDEDWARFIRAANDSGPDFTPEEDAEDIAFILDYEAKRERGELPPPVEWDDEYEKEHFPEDWVFFQRLDSEFPEWKDLRLNHDLGTTAGRTFMRRLREDFPEAVPLFMLAMPTE